MPLIQIKRNPRAVSDNLLSKVIASLPGVTAAELACREGGRLSPQDIMIEVDDFGPFDTNCKDLHIRIIAHDYPTRRGRGLRRLEEIRRQITRHAVGRYVPDGLTWYVWVLLSPTSYGSETMV